MSDTEDFPLRNLPRKSLLQRGFKGLEPLFFQTCMKELVKELQVVSEAFHTAVWVYF